MTVVTRKVSDIPGDIAIWILIFAELFEFALFFIIFIVAKAYHPELFEEGPKHLNTLSGLANTLVLLSSSWFIARSVKAIKQGRKQTSEFWLLMTMFAGLVYCAIKAWEYHYNSQHGITQTRDLFFSVYYYMTFNHLLHVLFGLSGMLWIYIRSRLNMYSAEHHQGLEAGACYWHMVDLAWIIIFPLLYVMR